MAPTSRRTVNHPSTSRTTSSGILSGVFSFVSRELESFVANATGSAQTDELDTLAEFSDEEQDVEQTHENLEVGDEEVSPSTPSGGARTANVDTSTPGPLPPRSTFPGVLKRRQSCTMPGSLFARSPSMDPEPNQIDLRVRFLADFEASPSSGPTQDHDPGEDNMPGPSSRLRSDYRLDTDRMGKSHRKSSVKAVVDKFRLGEKDADPSILLPSPTNSPGKSKIFSSGQLHSEQTGEGNSRRKGKQRAVSPVQEQGENPRDPLFKGKEKELNFVREEQRKHERRSERGQDDLHDKEKIRMLEEEIQRLKTELSRRSASTSDFPPPPPPPPPPPLSSKAILRLPTSSGDPDLLFASARAALKHAPTPSEAPINPPPSRRQGQPCIGIAPDKIAAFLTEMKTVRLRKVSRQSASAEESSSAARVPHKTSFTTLSLRPTNLARASRVSNKYSDILSAPLPAGMDAHVGEKRKRFDSIVSHDDPRPTAKRRSLPSSSDSSFASASTLSSFRLSSSTSLSISQPPSSRAAATSRNWRPPSTVDAPTPSLCSDNDNEREGDMSPEDPLPSTPPIPPSRGIFRFKGTGVPVEDEAEREVIDVDMLEVHSPPTKPTRLLEDGPAVLSQRHSTSFFDRRPPSSPMPAKSPIKPRPPACVPRSMPPPRPSDDSEDEDPLSMSIASQAGGSQPSDKASQSSQKQNSRQSQEEARRSSKQHSVRLSRGESSKPKVSKAELKTRRRQTLDEELRNASSDQEGGTDISLDDGILMGFGTMSKQRGFLAHGGAGGTPVFMGLGYVEGAEDPADEAAVDDEDDYPLTRFKTDSRRKGPRRS